MNVNRAKEILDSLGVFEVYFQGRPVWIEKINDDTAGILNLSTNERLEVPVKDLFEG